MLKRISDELVGLERAVDQTVAAGGLAAYGALELAFGEDSIAKSLFNKTFGKSPHGRIIPDTSTFRTFLELRSRPIKVPDLRVPIVDVSLVG